MINRFIGVNSNSLGMRMGTSFFFLVSAWVKGVKRGGPFLITLTEKINTNEHTGLVTYQPYLMNSDVMDKTLQVIIKSVVFKSTATNSPLSQN